jgi:hypothetical protein
MQAYQSREDKLLQAILSTPTMKAELSGVRLEGQSVTELLDSGDSSVSVLARIIRRRAEQGSQKDIKAIHREIVDLIRSRLKD